VFIEISYDEASYFGDVQSQSINNNHRAKEQGVLKNKSSGADFLKK